MTESPGDSARANSLVPNIGVLLVAAGLFTLVARAVATKRSRPIDETAKDWTQTHRTPAIDVAVKPLTVLSLPVVVVSATLALAWWLRENKRFAAALSVAVVPALAATAGQSFTSFLPQQNPPDAATGPSFPSGHTTGVMAEALTAGYVLLREDLSSPGALALLAAWPFVVAAARLYRNRHWTSDAIGGLLAGTAVAAMATMLYEVTKERTLSAPSPPRASIVQ